MAVVTKNGLWIRDKIKDNTLVINSMKIDKNYLIGNFITIFDKEQNVVQNIKSKKIDISNNEWVIKDSIIYNKNEYRKKDLLKLKQILIIKEFSLYTQI